jgi:alcohol dehydrogenase class IV
MHEPPTLLWSDVEALARQEGTIVWATRRARQVLGWAEARWIESADLVRDGCDLIVIGGGAHLDHVKRHWRGTGARKLIAVPTIWGSGAEASPIAVWIEDGKKQFVKSGAIRPDAMAFYEDFMLTLSPNQVRSACGDTWAHALEGFLSPLATDELRAELAALIRQLQTMPIGLDARWFSLSASASAYQACASVGLAHGIAHVLEPRLMQAGHASLCATLLAPVLRFNDAVSEKWRLLTARFDLDGDEILACVSGLSTLDERRALSPHVAVHWRAILRDPCTRSNSVLVRPDGLAALQHFLERP